MIETCLSEFRLEIVIPSILVDESLTQGLIPSVSATLAMVGSRMREIVSRNRHPLLYQWVDTQDSNLQGNNFAVSHCEKVTQLSSLSKMPKDS